MSGMWTVRGVTSVGMTVATCGFEPLFPLDVVLDVVLGGPRAGRPGRYQPCRTQLTGGSDCAGG
jgi:hypothetical protein